MGTIENAMKARGWTGARMRDACRNCKHGEARPGERSQDREHWHCKDGGFTTSPMAICDRYKRTWA